MYWFMRPTPTAFQTPAQKCYPCKLLQAHLLIEEAIRVGVYIVCQLISKGLGRNTQKPCCRSVCNWPCRSQLLFSICDGTAGRSRFSGRAPQLLPSPAATLTD